MVCNGGIWSQFPLESLDFEHFCVLLLFFLSSFLLQMLSYETTNSITP